MTLFSLSMLPEDPQPHPFCLAGFLGTFAAAVVEGLALLRADVNPFKAQVD